MEQELSMVGKKLVVVLAGVIALGLVVLANASASSGAPVGSATIGSATIQTGCAWLTETGNGGTSGFDSDTDATYWATAFVATPGAGINITGSFPHARYMSISAYNLLGPSAGVHFYDSEIQPATGMNPFQTGVSTSATGTYTVHIVAEPAPADPAPNTLYVGQNAGLVWVLYRIYDSDSPSDPTGGVGLPQVSSTYYGAVTGNEPGCVDLSTLLPGGVSLLSSSGGLSPLPGEPQVAPPTWAVANVTRFPDEDASYLVSYTNELFGQVVVIRAQMPTFPDTNDGEPAWTPSQVRYWSICDEAATTGEVAGCLADYSVVQSGGLATFVISTPAARPANATTADGVNWLPWGATVREIVVYRQLLANPGFGQSIAAAAAANAGAGDVPLSATMGPYYPQIAYCSTAEFESAGASGCLTANGSSSVAR